MNDDLKTSAAGFALIKGSEGCRYVAYWDPTGKCWTIAYGHIAGVQEDDTCDDAQAQSWLEQDVLGAEEAIKRLVTFQLNQDEFDALVDFVYNEGVGNFKKSTLLQLINASDTSGADAQFGRWDRSGGIVLQGLVTRRQTEARLFATPDPANGTQS